MEKQTYKFNNEIDTVEVTSIGAAIVIKPHDGNEILAEYDNPRDTPEFCAVLSGKTLTLKEKFSFNIFGIKPTEGYTITVFLPAVMYAKLKVNTASGGVDISGATAQTFELNTASGSVNIDGYFENISVQSASGNVTLNNTTGKNAKSLNICTVSGSTSISGCSAEKYSLHSVSGSIEYNGAAGEGSISVTSGDVNVSYTRWENNLRVSVISGNVNISLPEGSGMTLTYNGASGTLNTDLGNDKGKMMNLGRGTSGDFGGDIKHKVDVSTTSGTVCIKQQ
ncbi:MAG: DUF4097 family beta strand repeat-containing protein [Oscillospiraceae bacterium]